MSAVEQAKIFQDSINDYSDFHIKNQDLDDKLDLKRA